MIFFGLSVYMQYVALSFECYFVFIFVVLQLKVVVNSFFLKSGIGFCCGLKF